MKPGLRELYKVIGQRKGTIEASQPIMANVRSLELLVEEMKREVGFIPK